MNPKTLTPEQMEKGMRESFARLETTVKLAGAFLGVVSLIVSPIVTAALLRLVGA